MIRTEAQGEATRKWQFIGTRIRQLCCLDSIANRYLDQEQQKVIRDIVDSELHKMGYESLTERNARWSNSLKSGEYCNENYKFQRRE